MRAYSSPRLPQGFAAPSWTMHRGSYLVLAGIAHGASLLAAGCGEPLPSIPLDISTHNSCAESIPYVVDASASEIQCLVEDYIYISYANEDDMITEEGMNVPGPPVCCEVCATKDTADAACKAMCKHELCDRARDEHYAIGQALSACAPPSCGFNHTKCMNQNQLHIQRIDLLDLDDDDDPIYGLRTKCRADAMDPARPDGLFRYIEGLDAIPGAHGELAHVQDVVGYCQEDQEQPGNTDGSPPPAMTLSGNDSGADSTGAGASDTSPGGDPPEPPSRPQPCGPYAEQRYWVRPTSNFGTWNGESAGLGLDALASYPVTITGGGIAYTLLPCEAAADAQCLRIDQLSARWVHADSGLVVSLGLVQDSELMPMLATGHIDIPSGALRLAVRYEQDGRETLAMANNAERVRGHVDAISGFLHLTGLTATSEDGTMLATMSLHADLENTQPATEIIQNAGAAWNRVSLTARTFDAEFDPLVHHWTIPGVGGWTGDHIEVELPIGRHAVILRADDVHRSRGIAATWIDIIPTGN
jgi:hypothetical protein